MTEDNIHYVYEHWRPDTGVCFYVGMGRGRRAWTLRGRNLHHRAITSKLTSLGMAVDIRIVIDGLSRETAFAIEKDRIVMYGRSLLANKTDGGEGPAEMAVESRAAIAAALKGNKHSKGVRRTPEQRDAVASRMKGNKYWVGKTLTDQHKKNLSVAHVGKHFVSPRNKAVICLDDGKRFISAGEAARFYGVVASSINQLCNGYKGLRKTVGGKRFRYVEAA